VPSTAFVCCTGNGLTFVGDLTRRSLRCSLDPKVERPELRPFDFEPVALARERRGELVVAALTILRAYWVSGEQVRLPPYGSFEVWSHRVREALVWLGCADPCDTVENVRADDPERNALAAVLAQWEQHLGCFKPYTTAEVVKCATSTAVERGKDGRIIVQVSRAEFKEALLEIAGYKESINHRRLGIWLNKNEDKIVNGLRLCAKGIRDGSKRWALRPLRGA
jgi:putative DNA primase/helicase